MGDFTYYGIDIPLDVAFRDKSSLCHYGTPQHGGRPGSGRYEEGSGARPYQHGGGPSTNRGSSSKKATSSKPSRTREDNTKYGSAALAVASQLGMQIGASAALTLLGYGVVLAVRKVKRAKQDKIFSTYEKFKPNKDSTYDKEHNVYKLHNKESLDDTIANTNPYYGDKNSLNNCWSCSVAAAMRQKGYDVQAKPDGLGMIGGSSKYTKLLNNFKSNATAGQLSSFKGASANRKVIDKAVMRLTNGNKGSGLFMLTWKYGGGHVINWVSDGKSVRFYDAQRHDISADKDIMNDYIANMNGVFNVINFNENDIKWENLDEFVRR